ncbi:MAG: molybdopterin-dependent oxidoreductase [Coriobacteriales bacterium]|nr:molybdopterin-dependent oxidoreductase [Coriobacteriales bacterium]
MSQKTLSRRSFVKWASIAGAAASSVSFAASPILAMADEAQESAEEWKTAPCMFNCSCGSSRCLLKVRMEDGIPVAIKSDEDPEDNEYCPQRRACARGRSQISNVFSPARVKYPMKRKNWSPDAPNGELRGIDEWERISWDEALDIVAEQIKKTVDEYGSKGILAAAYSDIGDTYFDPVICLLNVLGGALHHETGTVSMGSWPAVELYMTGGYYSNTDSLSAAKSELHVHFGNNWVANKSGNTPYYMDYAREQGGKWIIIEPWLNQTAEMIADEWIPVRPGTDTALCLGIMYHWIENGLYDQEFLDKYCVGFDAEHMPEGANPEDNFKDYVLGTYDGEPKTPEWAAAICGTPADVIRSFAEEIAAAKTVDFFAGQSTTKIPAGEMFAQVFYTMAFMKGGLGTEGNSVAWVGRAEGISMLPFVLAGDASNGFQLNPLNPLTPDASAGGIPNFLALTNENWDRPDYTELWQSILDGAYGRDCWPGGKKPMNVHQIYSGGYENSLNSVPNANAGIKAYRSMDFTWALQPWFNASCKYSDVVLPAAPWWEKGELAWTGDSSTVYWADRIIDPMYEAMPESYVAEELAKRLGIDPKLVNTMTDSERTYCSIAGALELTDRSAMAFAPLFTITQEDLDELGITVGGPQEGITSFAEFKKKGYYKHQRSEGDKVAAPQFELFRQDPEAFPVATASGKLEIYCKTLADVINACGYSTISPIGKWQIGDPEQGQGTQTDEYPLLLWTPHSLRRAHTVNDNVFSLREAFPQCCFMSTYDAQKLGIENGDTVLMTSPYGQVLRYAKVLPTVVPGAVAMQDGAWINIDEATGIDLGGDPNILQAPKASGQASQSWTGTLVRVEKYTGDLKLMPDKETPLVLPVGIE